MEDTSENKKHNYDKKKSSHLYLYGALQYNKSKVIIMRLKVGIYLKSHNYDVLFMT